MNIVKKLVKYLILLAVLFISITWITKSTVEIYNRVAISLIGVSTFAILDQYAPSYLIEQDKH
jgi:hypothetical protein